MESRLKERLTGAAILVALIVLLVPEIFRGQHSSEGAASPASSSGSDGAPMRSYTIDLANNSKSGSPAVEGTETGGASTVTKDNAAATRDNAPPAASPPSSAPPQPPAVSTPVPTPVPLPTPAPAVPSRAPVAAPASHPPHAATAAAPSPKPATAAPRASAAAGDWSVQLGLFSKRENAERLQTEARAKGFQAGVSGADSRGQFHVRVSGLSDRASADALTARLKSAGFAAAVVAPR